MTTAPRIGRRWWVVSPSFISYPRYCHRSAWDLLALQRQANPWDTFRIVHAWTTRSAFKASEQMRSAR